MADNAFQLVVRKGPQPGQIIPLTEDVISIGRDPVSDIVFNDPEVSRHHARFTAGASGYILQDMASTNGSFVDGVRLGGEPYPLQPGQVIMFGGNVSLVYEALPESDPLATVVAPVSMPLEEEPPAEEVAESSMPLAPEWVDEEVVSMPEDEGLREEADAEIDSEPAAQPAHDLAEEEVAEIAAEAAVPVFDDLEDEEDLATIIDEPVEEQPEVEVPAAFPSFDDAYVDSAAPIDEAPVSKPTTLEPVEPEMDSVGEPEPAVPVFEEPVPPPLQGLEATMPDADYQPIIEPASASVEAEEPVKSGGVDRGLIIGVVLLVLMCCCIAGLVAVLIALDTFVQEDLIEGLDLGGIWILQEVQLLIR